MAWQPSLACLAGCPFILLRIFCRAAPKGGGGVVPFTGLLILRLLMQILLNLLFFHILARSRGFASLCLVESSTALPFLHRLVVIPPTLAVTAYSSLGTNFLSLSCLGSKISAVMFIAAP